MKGVAKIVHHDKEIWVIDYRDCSEKEMTNRALHLGAMIEREQKPALILSIFNNKCYATPQFMRQVEKETSRIFHLIDKQAMTGLDNVKKMILKGYNLLFNRNIRTFDSELEALNFLADGNTSDKVKDDLVVARHGGQQ